MKQSRRCFMCNAHYSSWVLLGGGYCANLYAALLREALPVALCEVCFRKSFYQVDAGSIEAVGMAILPDVEIRSVRQREIDTFLLQTKRLVNGGDFDCSRVLTSLELQRLLDSRTLFKSFHISPISGLVQTQFTFSERDTQGLNVIVSPRQESMEHLLGLLPQTRLMISCNPTGLCIHRTVSDFYWLREKYLQGFPGEEYPLLSPPMILGFFNEHFLAVRISAFEEFLLFVCSSQTLCQAEFLRAFFRGGFRFSKSALEVKARFDSRNLHSRNHVTDLSGPRSMRLTLDGSVPKLAISAQMRLLQLERVRQGLEAVFLKAAIGDSGLLQTSTENVSPVTDFKDVKASCEEIIRRQLILCRERAEWLESFKQKVESSEFGINQTQFSISFFEHV